MRPQRSNTLRAACSQLPQQLQHHRPIPWIEPVRVLPQVKEQSLGQIFSGGRVLGEGKRHAVEDVATPVQVLEQRCLVALADSLLQRRLLLQQGGRTLAG